MWREAGAVILVAYLAQYLYRSGFWLPSVTTELMKQYDYIVVGGGSAGAVIASRLSENPNVTVLLLEAGEEETKEQKIDIPLAVAELQMSPYDWQYQTETQGKSCLGMKNEKCRWPRGKVLGGTSNLNYMVYIRGSRHDYDEWAANGCAGWSYKDVLPYFLKSEGNQNEEYVKSGFHCDSGPLVVSDVKSTDLVDVFLDAGRELKEKVLDVNGEEQLGFGSLQATIKKGKRWSTAKAFLRPVLDRMNIHVGVNSMATRVLFEGTKAVAVEFLRNGKKYVVKATKEIILSAGAIGSPKLLLLSGIGPKHDLDKLNIPVVADLPVGENLQDHIAMVVRANIDKPYTITRSGVSSWWTLLEYFIFGTGYLASSGGVEAVAFTRTRYQPKDKLYPDIQVHLHSVSLQIDPKRAEIFQNYKEETTASFDPEVNENGFNLLPILLHPKSQGTVKLKSADPHEDPLIDPNYLDHPDDVRVMMEGMRYCQRVLDTEAFRKHGTVHRNKTFKACSHHGNDTDAFWECYLRHITATIYHPCCTCKMGAVNDPSAVVDPQLRVKGVQNLRVADASIMPNDVSGNTNAPSIMIGEKAADLILGINTVQNIKLPKL
ncbi:L-sorbose 1-dehydrogenase-like [Liolophura sinensis]|uniref:L-sorbose 1-dehydrogenase-like n=1 Tax=Liolophura sinensis TaxID=3198878 RepID=UPI003158057E